MASNFGMSAEHDADLGRPTPRARPGQHPHSAVAVHGVIAVPEDLSKCYAAASQVEESAHMAFLALQLGEPTTVPASEIERMHEFIHHRYGQRWTGGSPRRRAVNHKVHGELFTCPRPAGT